VKNRHGLRRGIEGEPERADEQCRPPYR
jgi:hypothetical protein